MLDKNRLELTKILRCIWRAQTCFTYHSVHFLHAAIITVPATTACGFDPCYQKACDVDFTAQCVTDADCRPTFITKTERILDDCVGK